ncbi:MFS transporter small subunit [Nonomuraea sp. CA-141351]
MMADQHGGASGRIPLMLLAWAWVSLPFAYGVYELLLKLGHLFSG